MRRIFVTAMAVVVVASAAFASAASLGLSSSHLAAGSDAVGRCGVDEIDLSFAPSVASIGAVTVSGLSDCEGGELTVVLTGGDGGELGTSNAAVVEDGEATVTFDPAVVGATDAQIVIVGGEDEEVEE